MLAARRIIYDGQAGLCLRPLEGVEKKPDATDAVWVAVGTAILQVRSILRIVRRPYMHDFYDDFARLYHLIFDGWDTSISRQGERLAAVTNSPDGLAA